MLRRPSAFSFTNSLTFLAVHRMAVHDEEDLPRNTAQQRL